jgi:hypothetical protein
MEGSAMSPVTAARTTHNHSSTFRGILNFMIASLYKIVIFIGLFASRTEKGELLLSLRRYSS